MQALPSSLNALPRPLSYDAVFNALENQFCPLLDSALLAVLLSDVDFTQSDPTASLLSLYETLESIAQHAEAEAALAETQDVGDRTMSDREGRANVKTVNSRSRSGTATTTTTDSTTTTTTWKTKTSSAAASSKSGSTSPSSISNQNTIIANVNQQALAFLRTALPQLPTGTLVNALAEWEGNSSAGMAGLPAEEGVGPGEREPLPDRDMWTLISMLVASEEAREMDERGMDFAAEQEEEGLVEPVEDTTMAVHSINFDAFMDPEDRAYISQLEADERMARALAKELEEEERRTDPVARVVGKNRVEDDEWVVGGAGKGKKKKTKPTKKQGLSGVDAGKVKIQLNDIRQSALANSTPKPPSSQMKIQGQGEPKPFDTNNTTFNLDTVLPSLASYLASLLPLDRPPSTMFLGAKPSLSSKTEISTYIQNVYLNDRVVKNRYGGHVYRALRACLESVVEVVKEVEAQRRPLMQEEQPKNEVRSEGEVKEDNVEVGRGKEEEEEIDPKAGGESKSFAERKEKVSRRKKKQPRVSGGGSGSFPPEERPHKPSKKMKNRVRTATDRTLEREREPGEAGVSALEDGKVAAQEVELGQESEEAVQNEDPNGTTGENGTDAAQEADEAQGLLLTLLDILLPKYALVETDGGAYVEVHQLLSDIELCISVLQGSQPDPAPPPKPKPKSKSLNRNGDEEDVHTEPPPQPKDPGAITLELATLLCDMFVSDSMPGREVGMFMEIMSGDAGGSAGAGWGPKAKRQVLSYAQTAGALRTSGGLFTGAQAGAGGHTGTGYRASLEVDVPELLGSTKVPGSDDYGAEKKVGQNKPSPYQWQAVKARKAPIKPTKMLLPHLPTYTRDVNGIKQNRADSSSSTLSYWVPGSGRDPTASDLTRAEAEHRRRLASNHRRRDELLHEAARMYNRGSSSKLMKGDIAWYFAERARECMEAAKREALSAARAMVLRRRVVSGDWDTIDLHGTTVSEAEVIVLEVLRGEVGGGGGKGKKRAAPLKIITGRGSHSVGGASVLKPAIRKRLVEEGYTIRAWDAGLVVSP